MLPELHRLRFGPIVLIGLTATLIAFSPAGSDARPRTVLNRAAGLTTALWRDDAFLLHGGPWARTYVRSDDSTHVELRASEREALMNPALPVVDPPQVCRRLALAWNGIPVAGEADLLPHADIDPVTVNRSGQAAIVGLLNSSERNQGVFLVEETGVKPIAVGCGSGGGSGRGGTCGDPSPIGGNFSGFFLGTPFAPAINDGGDVLFLADVTGGSAARGLFLFQAAAGRIVKVAALGDLSESGSKLVAVGPGSLNNSGTVAFLASRDGMTSDIFVWKDGVIRDGVLAGDPGPGGTFAVIGTEGLIFADRTYIPIGPVPALDEAGRLAFRAEISSESGVRGLYMSSNGAFEAIVQVGDPAPIGGVFTDFWAPLLNDAGQIAFEGEVRLDTGGYTGGWFTGRRNAWRKAVLFGDAVDGGIVSSLAVSRNPIQALGESGELAVWCSLSPEGGDERVLIAPATGSAPLVSAREGDPAPLGGLLGGFQPWPAFSHSRLACGAVLPGAPNGLRDAVLLVEVGPPAPIAWHPDADRDGHGVSTPTETACVGPDTWVPSGDDCNDADPAVHPGVVERCNKVDDDCDGTVDGVSCTPLGPLTPVNGTVIPADAPAPTFSWVGGPYSGYRVEWSASDDFRGGRTSGEGWPAATSLVPDESLWRGILRLGLRGGTIYWRVTGKSSGGRPESGPAGRFTLAPVQPSGIVSPSEAQSFSSGGTGPVFGWAPSHNNRFTLVFSTDPGFPEGKTVRIGGGYRLTGVARPLSEPEWKRIVDSSAAKNRPARVFFSVLSKDRLGRTARSPSHSLLVSAD